MVSLQKCHLGRVFGIDAKLITLRELAVVKKVDLGYIEHSLI